MRKTTSKRIKIISLGEHWNRCMYSFSIYYCPVILS